MAINMCWVAVNINKSVLILTCCAQVFRNYSLGKVEKGGGKSTFPDLDPVALNPVAELVERNAQLSGGAALVECVGFKGFPYQAMFHVVKSGW